LAVSRHGSVGIDIERVRPVRNPLRIATRVWPDDLVARLASRPDNDRLRSFFVGWTRFEACQKALGRGVFDPPVDPSGLQTSTFCPGPGYIACVAVVAAGCPPLHYFDFMPQ
jgi:phosphopantetheinyl transferase